VVDEVLVAIFFVGVREGYDRRVRSEVVILADGLSRGDVDSALRWDARHPQYERISREGWRCRTEARRESGSRAARVAVVFVG
jgi:hypothetical protein